MCNHYLNTIKKYIPKKRIEHSIRVSESAKRLAEIHKVNQDRVVKAALLHDIAKNQSPESLKALGVSPLYSECWKEFPAVWHAFVAPGLIEYECPGESSDISDMVRYHTTGHSEMDKEAMIIYIADFIEPMREHPNRKEMDVLSQRSLEEAVAWITHFSIEKLKGKNREIHPFTKDCWESYCKYIPDSEKWHQDD